MKTHSPFRRGIALVIVLVLLVLMLGLILAFFSGVTTQRGFSRTAADAASTQQLADSAVNIVMSQIVDATGTSAGTSSDNGSTFAWASQPGMIRTYDDTGAPQHFYKLYSSGSMIVPGSSFNVSKDDPENINGGWNSATNVGIYTDLNAPVLVSDTAGPIALSTGTYSAVYPIMDPFAENTSTSGTSNGVDGFWLSGRPGYVPPATTSGTNGLPSLNYDPTNTVQASGSTANPAPMPVQWLYVLSNGQVVAPSSSNNGVLSFNATQMSGTNPIVGRIAFWADDESSKVNINTASEGTYWDVPRIFSAEDDGEWVADKLSEAATSIPGMAICQPVQDEYQRYPGHPATTCLSPIFGNLTLSSSGNPVLPVPAPWQPWAYPISSPPVSLINEYNQYYAIAPRVAPGGSAGGTILSGGTAALSGTIATTGGSTGLVNVPHRLYASTDELMFTGSTGISSVSGTTARVTNAPSTVDPTLPGQITNGVLEKTRFFITANSNAPETTLFNTPRISMWPVWDSGQVVASGTTYTSGTTLQTAYDRLAAFCGATTGTGANANAYYFTRANARSDTSDYSGIPRNKALYGYLQTLTGQNIPGFGGNFSTKYGTDRDQILTLMFDYIRCINIADSEQGNPSAVPPVPSAVPYTPLFLPNLAGVTANNEDNSAGNDIGDISTDDANLYPMGAGEVVPIKIPSTAAASGTTMGVGRFLTISEADLLFYAITSGTGKTANDTASFRVALLLQFASPMQGMQMMRSSLQYSVKGLDQLKITTSGTTGTLGNFGFPSNATNLVELSDVQTYGGCGVGGVEGPLEGLCKMSGHPYDGGPVSGAPINPATYTVLYGVSTKTCTNVADTAGGSGHYPFFTPYNIVVSATTTSQNFTLTGGPFTITLSPQDNPSITVQTFNLNFPTGTFKVPNPAPDTLPPKSGYPSTGTIVSGFWRDLNNRLSVPILIGANGNWAGGVTSDSSPIGAVGAYQATISGTTPPYTVSCPLITGSDTLVGIQPAGASGHADSTAGDIRMIAAMPNVLATRFAAHKLYNNTGVQFAHGLMTASGDPYMDNALAAGNNTSALSVTGTGTAARAPLGGELVPVSYNLSGVTYNNYIAGSARQPTFVVHDPYVPLCAGTAVQYANASSLTPQGPGDWDTGIGNLLDGAYMNKPDDGDMRNCSHDDGSNLRYPYQMGTTNYSSYSQWLAGLAYFSPNRQVPSPLMFGSIPTGVQRDLPWQTLLFQPKPDDANHPGHGSPALSTSPYVASTPPLTTPPDHLIADLFWMPVVQPYAISQPLATAGKINLNYQIVPFTYIKRETGLYAVMKATKFAAIPLTDGTTYKPLAYAHAFEMAYPYNGSTYDQNPNRRYSINIPATLQACDEIFANSQIFRSATQICDINLIPNSIPSVTLPSGLVSSGTTVALWQPPAVVAGSTAVEQYAANYMTTFWSNNQLTGDNLREKPYVDIYPRLTTKSNTYTVHFWVQSLRQNSVNANAQQFVDPIAPAGGVKDAVVSEYRGSTTIERYIDLNANIPDFASNPGQSLDPYYKFRVVGVKRFSP